MSAPITDDDLEELAVDACDALMDDTTSTTQMTNRQAMVYWQAVARRAQHFAAALAEDVAREQQQASEPVPEWACATCRHPFYEHRESSEYRLLNARTPLGATGCVHSGCGCAKADESHLT